MNTYIQCDVCIVRRRRSRFAGIIIEVNMEQIEHHAIHRWSQTIAQSPDTCHHALHQPLLVSVRVHAHEG